jgi:hypothetical protein
VKWREVDEILELASHLFVDADGVSEALASVHDAMSDCLDFSDARDGDAGLIAHEPTNAVFDSACVVANRVCAPYRFASRCRERENCFASDSLDQTTGESSVGGSGDCSFIGVDELKLDRRRSDVEDENFH